MSYSGFVANIGGVDHQCIADDFQIAFPYDHNGNNKFETLEPSCQLIPGQPCGAVDNSVDPDIQTADELGNITENEDMGVDDDIQSTEAAQIRVSVSINTCQ